MKPVKKKTQRDITWLRIGTTTLGDVGTWLLALGVSDRRESFSDMFFLRLLPPYLRSWAFL